MNRHLVSLALADDMYTQTCMHEHLVSLALAKDVVALNSNNGREAPHALELNQSGVLGVIHVCGSVHALCKHAYVLML